MAFVLVAACAALLPACGAPGVSASPASGAVAGAAALARTTPSAPRGPIAFDYAVRWIPAEGALAIEARLSAIPGGALTVERGAEGFVERAEAAPDRDGASSAASPAAAFAPMRRQGRVFEAAACAAGPCRVRYRVALRAAAARLDDLDTASDEGAVVEAVPSVWLLAPAAADGADRALRLRFRVTCPEGSRFVTGVFRSDEDRSAFDITLADLPSSPYSAFGPLRVRTLPVKGAELELAIAPGDLSVSDDELARWTEDAARAVTTYLDRFPMRSALVLLVPAEGRWVGGGRTLAGGGGTVFMRVGARADRRELARDWVLVHEMTHLAFPSVPREQDWAEEGLATYVEPFARVRAGLLTEEEAWRGLLEGLPNGLPGPGDQGLDRTPTWGRIYWGGALFWLLADVEIRKKTQNRLGLEHALRGINAAGGTNASRWALGDALAAGDRATGVSVLVPLHAAMGAAPHPVDLAELGRSLGVSLAGAGSPLGARVRFDDAAPLASVRKSIAHGTDAATLGDR